MVDEDEVAVVGSEAVAMVEVARLGLASVFPQKALRLAASTDRSALYGSGPTLRGVPRRHVAT